MDKKMEYTLKSGQFTATIKEHGAELSSFRSQDTGLEYIWTADPAVWPRHAPVLFPIVGKVPGGRYRYEGQTYELPQHGFARDQAFFLHYETENSVVLALTDSPETRSVFPFPFRLQVGYVLQENSLLVTYEVHNPGPEKLLFSIGAHPGFNCPLLPGERFEDYYLEFEKPETTSRYLVDDGLQNGDTELVLASEKILPLHYALFEKDAIVLKDLQSERISLRTKNHPHGLDFLFPDYPYIGIWTKEPGAHFLCLEPWHGIASRIGDSGELTEKEGIRHLAAGETFTCSYTIRVF